MVFPTELVVTQCIEVSLCHACKMLHIIQVGHCEATIETMFSFAVMNLKRGKKNSVVLINALCVNQVSQVQFNTFVFLYFEYTFISVLSAVFSYFESMQDRSVFQRKESEGQIKRADINISIISCTYLRLCRRIQLLRTLVVFKQVLYVEWPVSALPPISHLL